MAGGIPPCMCARRPGCHPNREHNLLLLDMASHSGKQFPIHFKKTELFLATFA